LGISPWKSFKANPEDYFDKEEIARSRRYVKPLRIANVLRIAVNLAVDLAVIRTHAMPRLLNRLDLNNWVLEVFVVAAALLVIGLVVNTGFSWWQSMVYDKKWEFSTMTPATFFGDLGKSIGLGLVLNGIVFVLLWWIIRGTDLWWLFGWAALSAVSVGYAIVYLKLISPMFNKFKTLEDEELHADLLAVAHGVGADVSKVEVQDASKRDKRSNAYVGGLGRTRRMVLFDNMLEWPKDEVRWVCAHEIGHWRRKHLLRMIPAVLALQLVDFIALKLIFTNDAVLRFAGVKALGDPGAIPLFMFVFALPGLVTGLAVAWVSRAHERDADLFGLEAVPDPEAAKASFKHLATDSLADLTPSLWKRLNHSHPEVAERLAMIEEWDRRNAS
jgi:STE24 endopeptidase